MASKIQDQLLEEFGGLFQGGASGADDLAPSDTGATQSATEVITQIEQSTAEMATAQTASGSRSPASDDEPGEVDRTSGGGESLRETIEELSEMAVNSPGGAAASPAGVNSRAGSSTSSSSSDTGSSVESIATTFLESGLGIVPLITSLVGLFSGGSDAPPALEHYVMPSAISFESADVGNNLTPADFDQTGAARMYDATAGSSGGNSSSGDFGPGSPASGSAAPSAPQISVNVQAIDAQSFMDYSTQIAQAVRGAMLNLSSLNDVVNEL